MQQMIKRANQIRYIYIYVYSIHTYVYMHTYIHTHTHSLSLSLYIYLYTYHNLVNIAKVSLWNQLAAMGLRSTPSLVSKMMDYFANNFWVIFFCQEFSVRLLYVCIYIYTFFPIILVMFLYIFFANNFC